MNAIKRQICCCNGATVVGGSCDKQMEEGFNGQISSGQFMSHLHK